MNDMIFYEFTNLIFLYVLCKNIRGGIGSNKGKGLIKLFSIHILINNFITVNSEKWYVRI